ncbi:MAG: hypothetical protein KDC98_11295 [Planctomycetes bacterium]|nr:hypothetical protein [Planctomycetota bacterium]
MPRFDPESELTKLRSKALGKLKGMFRSKTEPASQGEGEEGTTSGSADDADTADEPTDDDDDLLDEDANDEADDGLDLDSLLDEEESTAADEDEDDMSLDDLLADLDDEPDGTGSAVADDDPDDDFDLDSLLADVDDSDDEAPSAITPPPVPSAAPTRNTPPPPAAAPPADSDADTLMGRTTKGLLDTPAPWERRGIHDSKRQSGLAPPKRSSEYDQSHPFDSEPLQPLGDARGYSIPVAKDQSAEAAASTPVPLDPPTAPIEPTAIEQPPPDLRPDSPQSFLIGEYGSLPPEEVDPTTGSGPAVVPEKAPLPFFDPPPPPPPPEPPPASQQPRALAKNPLDTAGGYGEPEPEYPPDELQVDDTAIVAASDLTNFGPGEQAIIAEAAAEAEADAEDGEDFGALFDELESPDADEDDGIDDVFAELGDIDPEPDVAEDLEDDGAGPEPALAAIDAVEDDFEDDALEDDDFDAVLADLEVAAAGTEDAGDDTADPFFGFADHDAGPQFASDDEAREEPTTAVIDDEDADAATVTAAGEDLDALLADLDEADAAKGEVATDALDALLADLEDDDAPAAAPVDDQAADGAPGDSEDEDLDALLADLEDENQSDTDTPAAPPPMQADEAGPGPRIDAAKAAAGLEELRRRLQQKQNPKTGDG